MQSPCRRAKETLLDVREAMARTKLREQAKRLAAKLKAAAEGKAPPPSRPSPRKCLLGRNVIIGRNVIPVPSLVCTSPWFSR